MPQEETQVPELPDLQEGPRKFPPGFCTEEVLVTPEMAERYLKTMHRNRSKSRVEVGIQAENLKDRTWYPEISPVFFDDEDRPYDGQHRFQAITDTGIAAHMLFIRGVTPEAAEFVDTGRRRSYADTLKIHDVPDYKRMSVLAKYMALHQRWGIEGIRNPGKFPVTQSAKDHWIENPALLEAVHLGEGIYRTTKSNGTWASYAILRTGFKPDGTWEADFDGFWDKVRHGNNLDRGDPALTLHNWLMMGRNRDRRPADRRLMELYAYSTAWNKHVLGQTYQKVSPTFDRRGDGSLYFPGSRVNDFLPSDAGKKGLAKLKEAAEAAGIVP